MCGAGGGRGSHTEVFGGNERGLDEDSKQKHSELARRSNSTANGATARVVWWLKQEGPRVLTQHTTVLMCDWSETWPACTVVQKVLGSVPGSVQFRVRRFHECSLGPEISPNTLNT